MRNSVFLIRPVVQTLASVLVAMGCGTLADAQVVVGGYGGAYAVPAWGGWGTTAAGSYAQGMGNVIRSQGMYNLATSEAMINAEEARRLELENQQRATEVFFEKRRINYEARAAERARTQTRDPYDVTSRRVASTTQRRLTTSQLDPVTGEIAWPAALTSDDFASQREALEGLFSERANFGWTGDAQYQVMQQLDAMRAELNARVMSIRPQMFTDASSFINAMREEARFGELQSARLP